MTLIRTVVIDDDHEGLDLITRLNPDLVLLDIHLPGLDGIGVLRAARNLPGDPIDFIAITAARDLETVRAAMAGGVMHYLVKPFTSTVLLERLDQYLQHRSDVREHASVRTPVLDQVKIDRMLQPRLAAPPTLFPASVILTPSKGLSEVTLAAVVATLRRNSGGTSASEIAQQLGLARVSARRYLEFLASAEQVGMTQNYGRAGRHEKLYFWNGAS